MLLAFLAALIPALDQFNAFAIPYLHQQGLNRIETSLILVPAAGFGGYLLWNLLIRGLAAGLKWIRAPLWVGYVFFVEGKPTSAKQYQDITGRY